MLRIHLFSIFNIETPLNREDTDQMYSNYNLIRP